MDGSMSRALAATSRMVDAMERHKTLSLMMACWRLFAEESQKNRREKMFDAMMEQTKFAKSRCQAYQKLSDRCLQVIEASQMPVLLQLVISAWRSGVWQARERRQQEDTIGDSMAMETEVAAPMGGSMSVPLSQSLSSVVGFTGSMSVPHGSGVAGRLQRSYSCQLELGAASPKMVVRAPRPSSTDRARHPSPTLGYDAAANQRPNTARSGRQPLVPLEEGAVTETKKPIRRGPERFFYDTTGYTGCARFGGPTVVDKENNVGQGAVGTQAASAAAMKGRRMMLLR